MRIKYDKSVDAMYVTLSEKLKYKSSKKISDDFLVDYSTNGQVMGVEILEASKNGILYNSTSNIPVEFAAA